MRIAAIISLPTQQNGEAASDVRLQTTSLSTRSYASLEILGQTLLDRLIFNLKGFGIQDCTLLSEDANRPFLPSRTAPDGMFVNDWENALASYVRQGVDYLLLVRLNTYNDIDYGDMIRFHTETKSALTQAHASDGLIDVAVVNTSSLAAADAFYWQTLSGLQQRRYAFRGYVNRLSELSDFHRLANDGLYGRCNLAPIGEQTRDWVWQAQGSEIDDCAVVTGPVFIGAGSRIAACCTISGGVSVERNCEVDCGTVVQDSWITQNTYLGVALDVRRAIVTGNQLFKVDRNVAISIDDDHLIANALKSVSYFSGLSNFLRRTERAA